MPRGIIAVYAMARPRRPEAERALVIAAAGKGSAAQCARRLAQAVAAAAMRDIDADPADGVIAILRGLSASPIDVLATDAVIDTAALIVAERIARLKARGGRRLPECEGPVEDREVLAAVSRKLAERYGKHLRAK